MRVRNVILVLVVAAVSLAAGALGRPLVTSAQSAPPSSDAFMAPGPGGMWVMRENRVYVCGPGLVIVGTAPSSPQCSPPLVLR